MAKLARFFPIKYKFLLVILSLLVLALGIFFSMTYRTFLDDKKLFVLDLNVSVLDGATNAVSLETRTRIEELGGLMARYFANSDEKADLFQNVWTTSSLPEEVLRATIYKLTPSGPSLARTWKNTKLIGSRQVPDDAFSYIDSKYPLPLNTLFELGDINLLNRSVNHPTVKTGKLGIITFAFSGKSNNAEKVLFAIDLTPDFLIKALKRSEVAEIFLLNSQGSILGHPQLAEMVEYAQKAYPHPAVLRLKEKKLSKESFEGKVKDEPHFLTLGDTAFKNVFIVSQVKRSQALLALRRLTKNSLFLLAGVIYGIILIGVFVSRSLTSNIQTLKIAAEAVGQGNLDVQVPVKSNDEIQKVADSFRWMIQRVKELLAETAQKARMEEELKTASLVQSTLLTRADVSPEWPAEIGPFYSPASECGGDFWDLQWNGNTITVVLGDATGHGASAAIITAVAKSFFSTLSMLHPDSVKKPDEYLANLNKIIYESCKGKLLMTMVLVQLNVETGEITIVNAGHESPMLLPAKSEPGKKKKPDVLFARGERLGFTPDAKYEISRFKANIGDTILLYTDGVSEAHDPEGKEFSERALKKTLSSADGKTINETKDCIVQAVNDHRKGTPQADDITFVLMRWNRIAADHSEGAKAA